MNKRTHTPVLPAANTIEKLELSYPHTFALLRGDDEVTAADILIDMQSAGLTESDLPLMEAALNVFPEYRKGLPFVYDDATYAQRLQRNNGLGLLQKFFNFWH